MYKNLYDNFAHWFHDGRGTVYLYSDPHFNDPEMVELRKNYISDEEQIKRINSKIGKYDTLVVLGDVGDIEWVRKIRGYKVLVMGNHDAGATNYKRKIVDILPKDKFDALGYKMTWCHYVKDGIVYYDNHLFDEVYEGPLFISEKILLSHEPIMLPFAFNIHGHDHGRMMIDGKHYNVCAEHINYTPISLKDIVKSGVLNRIDDIHRCTIDKATEKKKKRNR